MQSLWSRKILIDDLTVHYWQNWKRVFLSCYFDEIYRVEAVGLKNYNHTLKITIFVIMNFGAISLKIDISAITAKLKIKSDNSFAHMLPL